MPALIVAVVLIATLSGTDLILSIGVIKRLREHSLRLSNADASRGRKSCIGVGEEVGEFVTTTVKGERLSREQLSGDTLVGFFSPTCEPCRAELPKFVEFARTVPGGRDRVLAAVVGSPDNVGEMVEALAPVARVVVERYNDDAFSAAFQVMAFPTVLMIAPDDTGRSMVRIDRTELTQSLLVAS